MTNPDMGSREPGEEKNSGDEFLNILRETRERFKDSEDVQPLKRWLSKLKIDKNLLLDLAEEDGLKPEYKEAYLKSVDFNESQQAETRKMIEELEDIAKKEITNAAKRVK